MTIHKVDGIGMVNGLWANSLGVGGVLPIETVLIPTNEMMGVKATGSLGNVIKESIDVAISVAWSWLDQSTKDKWMKKWKTRPERFHVHCPDGSTNKEGPSAGAAMSIAFYSRLTNKTIRHTIAMTGEINLRGEVSEIGGLEEKLSAAKRAGATLVLVPQENEMDLIEIKRRYPTLIDSDFQIKYIKTFDDVIRHSLL
jgi:ATP-dependent Lon protease